MRRTCVALGLRDADDDSAKHRGRSVGPGVQKVGIKVVVDGLADVDLLIRREADGAVDCNSTQGASTQAPMSMAGCRPGCNLHAGTQPAASQPLTARNTRDGGAPAAGAAGHRRRASPASIATCRAGRAAGSTRTACRPGGIGDWDARHTRAGCGQAGRQGRVVECVVLARRLQPQHACCTAARLARNNSRSAAQELSPKGKPQVPALQRATTLPE